MTLTIFRITLLRLWNNPLELLLVFVVPCIFFSIFAMIFSHGIATGETKRVRIGVVDPAKTELAENLMKSLTENGAIDCKRLSQITNERSAEAYVRSIQSSNKFDLILRLLPRNTKTPQSDGPKIALITDGQNPMAVSITQSLVKGFFAQQIAQQKLSVLLADPRTNPAQKDQNFSSDAPGVKPGRFINPKNRPALKDNPETLPRPREDARKNPRTEIKSEDSGVAQVVVQNPQSEGQANPRVAMYAAGIAVLFLLFSATGNAATILEEHETGTLDRILASRARLGHVLLGKWLGIFSLGCLQLTAMFVWADLVFGIDLYSHVPGFCAMTASTSAATASFAMFLATICRSRAQLSAVSVLLILSMSALGGSMIPRFVMSDRMRDLGKWTFNAWAIDGYQKVFWYNLPVKSLEDEMLVLYGSALILGILSLVLSSRWKKN